jgi:hypothetical protein
MIAGYLRHLRTLDDAIAKFALAYAEQSERTFDALGQGAPVGTYQGGGREAV